MLFQGLLEKSLFIQLAQSVCNTSDDLYFKTQREPQKQQNRIIYYQNKTKVSSKSNPSSTYLSRNKPTMKTHMNNTTALNMKNDIMAHNVFQNHQQALHSGAVKPKVVTIRKEQIKIVKNNKVQINSNPNQHVNHLFNSLHSNKKNIKSTIDNKVPHSYQLKQTVLKDKIRKNKVQNHKLKEHEREWKALQDRIQNCKSLQQRKKDKTDPIVNPVYFVKDSSKADNVNIQQYCRKILQMNRPKSAVQVGTRNTNSLQLSHHRINNQNLLHQPKSISYGSSVPNYSKTSLQGNNQFKNRPSTAKDQQPAKILKNTDDLPGPTFKGILGHLLNNKIYKDADVKVLYVRMCYAYGEDNIDEVWQQVMDHLQK